MNIPPVELDGWPLHTPAEMADVLAEVTQLRAIVDRVRRLAEASDPGDGRYIPADRTLVVRTAAGGHQDMPETSHAFQRVDLPGAPKVVDLYSPVFFPTDGPTDAVRPISYGEILWLDDPACDRGIVELEAFVPLGALVEALGGDV